MADVQELLRGVKLNPDLIDPEAIEVHEDYGFMYDSSFVPGANSGDIRLIGFAAPYHLAPRFSGLAVDNGVPVPNMDAIVTPVTQYRRVPASLRNIKHLSHGVGTRLHRDWQSARSGSDLPVDYVGAYALTMDLARLYDRRPAQGGPVWQIAQYAVKKAVSVVRGARPVVERVHYLYDRGAGGTASAVLMDVPPKGERDQRSKDLQGPEGTSAFMILRDPKLRLELVGRVGHVALEETQPQ